ncbi:MAG: dienelactone hydrolase family protein [Chloroflexi bacterium]|nr:dienelactone hydrolase family protein [Chloroflexota bacterium]
MDVTTRMVDIPGDGAPMQTYIAEPKDYGTYSVVLIFMHGLGLDAWMKSAAQRFASEGFVAVMPNMYYRAGRETTFQMGDPRVMPTLNGLVDAQTNADTRIALDYIKTLSKARADRIACTGYCMGGTLSWLAACLNRDIKAAAVYYSGSIVARETTLQRPISPHRYAELLTAPVLGCFGETDANLTPADVRQVEADLRRLGKVHDFKIYPGVGHAFACDARLQAYNREAAEDAWKRTLG